MSDGEGHGEGNRVSPGANGIIGTLAAGGSDDNLGGGGARLSSLSLSFHGGGDLPQRSRQEHKEPEEKGDTEDEEEEEEEEEEKGVGLAADGDVPSRVTLRKRRGQWGAPVYGFLRFCCGCRRCR